LLNMIINPKVVNREPFWTLKVDYYHFIDTLKLLA
jgi:hypothetical protein